MSSSSTPEPAPQQPQAVELSTGKPWGFWATVGFSLVILFAWLVVQVVVTVVYLFGAPSGRALFDKNPLGVDPAKISNDGTLLALATTCTGILIPPLCILFAWLKRGISTQKYLGLVRAPTRQTLGWLGAGLLFAAASDTVTWLLGRPIVPEFMDHAYRSAAFVPLLWFAVVVGAPLFEEFFFRGFALAGLRYSRLGAIGAVLLTALGWTALHTQYDLIDLSDLFLFGLLLGYARIRSGSLFVPIGMHALNNLWATVEAAIKVRYSS